MRNDLSEIVVVMDRSGSMQNMQQEAQNSLNTFIKEQAESEHGETLFSLIEFDNKYEWVHKHAPIKAVPNYILHPRNMTALNDAVGRAINETGERLAQMDEKDRPGLVTFVIITDGLENASKEFKTEQVKAMIEHQQNVYNWKFVFFGANQDAFSVGQKSYGVSGQSSVTYTPAGMGAAVRHLSSKVQGARKSLVDNEELTAGGIELGFTEEERKDINK